MKDGRGHDKHTTPEQRKKINRKNSKESPWRGSYKEKKIRRNALD